MQSKFPLPEESILERRIHHQVEFYKTEMMDQIFEVLNHVICDQKLQDIKDLLIEEIEDTYLHDYLKEYAYVFFRNAILKLHADGTFANSIQTLLESEDEANIEINKLNNKNFSKSLSVDNNDDEGNGNGNDDDNDKDSNYEPSSKESSSEIIIKKKKKTLKRTRADFENDVKEERIYLTKRETEWFFPFLKEKKLKLKNENKEKKQWDCGACTLINEAGSKCCSCCGCER